MRLIDKHVRARQRCLDHTLEAERENTVRRVIAQEDTQTSFLLPGGRMDCTGQVDGAPSRDFCFGDPNPEGLGRVRDSLKLALFANSPRCNGASAAEGRPAVINVTA